MKDPNANVSWNEDEDHILQTSTNLNNAHLKLLRKYKTDERIKRRISFKDIILPFEFI